MNKSFKYAWREIRRRKMRTAGMVLVYALIAAIILTVSSLTQITREAVQGVLWDIGAHAVAYIPRLTLEGCCIQKYATDNYDPDREGFVVNNAPSNVIQSRLIEQIRKSPFVKDAAPYLMFRIRSSLGDGEWLLGGLDLTRPVAHAATVVAPGQVTEGKFLTNDDNNRIMVEKEFADIHGLKAGSDLQLGDTVYHVAAVVSPPLRPGKANIYMRLADLRELVDSRLEEPVNDPANAVLIESKGASFHERAKADVARILGQSSRISSYGCYQPGILSMGVHKNTVWVISVLVILSMVLLVMKTQVASVKQRRNDIGILKAIGWRDRDISRQLLTETVICSFSGAVIGVIAGLLLIHALPSILTAGGQFGPGFIRIIAGIVLPVITGVAAGMISSGKALRINPAEILRSL